MCNSPLRAFYTGYNTEKGGKAYRICPADTECINKPIPDIDNNTISTKRLYSNNPKNLYTDWLLNDYVEIPCGKCLQCRIDYTRTWAIRCYLESLQWEHNYMITLTYNDQNIQKSEKTGKYTLYKKDFQDFMKRFRDNWARHHDWKHIDDDIQPGIRYFCAGEYGGADEYTDTKGQKRKGTERPHYHFLAFNCPLFDLKPFFLNEFNQQVYLSAELEQIWGCGQVTVCEVNWNTCAYVARYILKKQKGPDAEEYYNELGIVPEFTCMSLKPAIGKKYFDEHKHEIFENDEIVIRKQRIDERYQLKEEIVRVKPPKYFVDLFALEEPDFVEALKKHRKICAKENKEMLLSQTTLDANEYLANCERKLSEKIKNIRHKMFEEVG